ncbi:methyltransferase [Haloarchaeobius sp. HME9146]|uniref:class I SAM-dependent methyltransferase n=1 Tax=Haloarchaeobius sp. HME9146 TaxID=2978732 RepID=UPI0021C1FC0B|nr:methyltransferase [Haloarchaeobius sp. HME9146]MCT9094839.1 methyltransferase [Haloarchaeobius sp. HME9146]
MSRSTADLALEAQVAEGPDRYRFRTADGVHSGDAFREPDLLLLEHLWDADLGALCCLEATYGVPPVVLANQADTVQATESSARAAALCERNCQENGVDAAVDCLADPATLPDCFDTVTYAPKPYTAIAMGKRRLAAGLSLLRPGGSFYLAAATRTGLSRYEDCLRELAGTVETVGSEGDYRLIRSTRPSTIDPPEYAPLGRIDATLDGHDCTFVTRPGLFSASSVDHGTRLLVETAAVEDGERVLDLCCGYGPVGTYAGLAADCEVWLTDDDAVATACAEASLDASGVDATVVTADCTAGVADRTFDRVLCNPPTHAGDGVLRDLFAGAHDVLAPGGSLLLVHHRELDLRPSLTRFDRVERRATGAEHVVLAAVP